MTKRQAKMLLNLARRVERATHYDQDYPDSCAMSYLHPRSLMDFGLSAEDDIKVFGIRRLGGTCGTPKRKAAQIRRLVRKYR